MLHSKYILEDGNLVLAKVEYHKHLIEDETKMQGGGSFRFDLDKKTCLFFGESYKYGPCKMEDVKKAIEEGKVYTNMIEGHNISKDFKFLWDRNYEIIELN